MTFELVSVLETDPEILQLQDGLERMRKRRILLELQSELAHKKLSLNNARQRLNEIVVQLPSQDSVCDRRKTIESAIRADVVPADKSRRTVKRSHSEVDRTNANAVSSLTKVNVKLAKRPHVESQELHDGGDEEDEQDDREDNYIYD
jgi:hypothetical protein